MTPDHARLYSVPMLPFEDPRFAVLETLGAQFAQLAQDIDALVPSGADRSAGQRRLRESYREVSDAVVFGTPDAAPLPRRARVVVFEPLHEDVQIPTRATQGSAGYDLRAYLRGQTVKGFNARNEPLTLAAGHDTVTLMPGDRIIIPTGFKATVPDGHFGAVVPKSGQAYKVGLTLVNAPGIVDSDFPSPWGMIVENISTIPLVIDHQEKIAQLVVQPYLDVDFVVGTVGQTTDRQGGFGSTGVR